MKYKRWEAKCCTLREAYSRKTILQSWKATLEAFRSLLDLWTENILHARASKQWNEAHVTVYTFLLYLYFVLYGSGCGQSRSRLQGNKKKFEGKKKKFRHSFCQTAKKCIFLDEKCDDLLPSVEEAKICQLMKIEWSQLENTFSPSTDMRATGERLSFSHPWKEEVRELPEFPMFMAL